MKLHFFRILVLALVVGLVTSAHAVAQNDSNAQEKNAEKPPEYVLGTGDKLRVSVFGERNLSGTFDVNGLGFISMPMIGDVEAKTKTIRQLEGEIIGKLKDGILLDPKVSVEVLNFRPFYILGEVRTPGSYAYFNGVTILKAVAMAGGFTYRANKSKIYVVRATDKTNTKVVVGEHDVILPGDIITVSERFF